MEEPYYKYTEGSTSVDIGVRLQGMNSLPASANLSVQQRTLKSSQTLAGPTDNLDFWLEEPFLEWEPENPGLQTVKLHVSGNLTALSQGGLLVEIVAAENADIEDQNSTSMLTALSSDSLVVGFSLEPNQVNGAG